MNVIEYEDEYVKKIMEYKNTISLFLAKKDEILYNLIETFKKNEWHKDSSFSCDKIVKNDINLNRIYNLLFLKFIMKI